MRDDQPDSTPVADTLPPPANATVAQTLLGYLQLEGATTMFGVPGGALIFVMNELKKQNSTFTFVICRHESGAAYAAHGYALVSGKLGVVLTTSGPSATNALTATMNAQTSNCPLLTISGEVPQPYFGEGYLQEGIDAKLDVTSVFRNAVDFSTIITSPTNFGTLFRQALRTALSRPAGVSHVSLTNDVANQPAVDHLPSFPTSPMQYRATSSGVDPDKTRPAFEELKGATRPLLFLGNGARAALADTTRLQKFKTFVSNYAIPVMTTPDAKGIFPETHEMSLRNYGLTGCTWPSVYMQATGTPNHFDALLVLGSTLGELATSPKESTLYSTNLIPTMSFTQVDLDPTVIGRDFPITRGIVAEVGATIDLLCQYGSSSTPDPSKTGPRKTLIGQIKQSSPFADPNGRSSNKAPIHPAALVRVMNETITSGHVFIDCGNAVGWSLNNLVVDPPLHYYSTLGMGPMGFATAGVIGGKLAAPNDVCVALVGDGAFMMHGAEVSTAAQYGVGAIWVVLYDNDLAMVSQGMGALFPPASSWADYYKLGAPDLVKFAEGLGAQAVDVPKDQPPATFAKALKTAINQAAQNKRPQVIVVHIDTTAMPAYGWPTVGAQGGHSA